MENLQKTVTELRNLVTKLQNLVGDDPLSELGHSTFLLELKLEDMEAELANWSDQ